MLLETILGGLTGLIGNAITGIFKYKTLKLELEVKKMQFKHDLDMVKAETEAMIEEAKANIAITEAQVEGAVELADAGAYVESQKQGNKSFFGKEWIDRLLAIEGKWKILTVPCATFVAMLFGFVDFLRGFMRPALTAYLMGMSTWITVHAYQIMQMAHVQISSDQAVQIFNNVTSIMIYLTTSVVTWWFGDRRMAKSIMQLQGVKDKSAEDILK